MDVVVLGSLVMDVVAFCERQPVPGETLIGTGVGYFPGGKGANQALAASKAGLSSRLIGAVGSDAFGITLRDFLFDNNVDTQSVAVHPGLATGVGLITVSATGENAIVFIEGANGLATVSANVVQEPVIALAQFEIAHDQTLPFFRQVRAAGGTTILNPSPYREIAQELLGLCSYLIMNELEFAAFTGGAVTIDKAEVKQRLLALPPSVYDVIVTLGSAGFVMKVGQELFEAEGHVVKAIDTTGAGDCFAGSFAAELAHGAIPYSAALYANAAAALSVTKAGAGPSMPGRDAVEGAMATSVAA